MKKMCYLCAIMMLSTNLMAQNKQSCVERESSYCSYFGKYLEFEYPEDELPIAEGWIYNSYYSDEFNGNSLNSSKWTKRNQYYHSNNTSIGYLAENVCVNNGSLILSVTYNSVGQWYYNFHDDEVDSIFSQFSTGAISSSRYIRYGYYEVECYLPKNHLYHPCFWTIGGDTEYDEIDVFELTLETDSPYIFLQNEYSNVHDSRSSKTCQQITMSDSITGKTSRFGVEVLPYELVFYINGHVSSRLIYNSSLSNSTNSFTCSDITKTVPMQVVLSFNTIIYNNEIPLPHEDFVVNYFRCYKLKRGAVDTYQPVTFVHTGKTSNVYPHIVLGGSGCSAIVNTATALWAEQDIVLDKGFELSAGTPFSARIIQHGDENPEESPLYTSNCPP